MAEPLGRPLDVVLVRKLGLRTHRELAMGAFVEDGVRVLDEEVLVAPTSACPWSTWRPGPAT